MYSKKIVSSALRQLNRSVQQRRNITSAVDSAVGQRIAADSMISPDYKWPTYLTRVAPTQTTVLDNGFRIVTEPRLGETASIGVFIRAGSRHEDITNNGAAHFLEHMYFKGTKSRTARSLEVEIENAGAYMNAHTSREYTAFTSHCLKDGVELSVDVLSDVLLNSEISTEMIEAERSTIMREMESVNQNIDEVLFDQLHLTAFPDSSLGYTILGPEKNIRTLNRKQMQDYRGTFYTAPRMVLVGVGNVDHKQLSQLGEKYFSKVPSRPQALRSDATAEANYVGSSVQIYNPDVPQLHCAIGFEGPGLSNSDILVVNLIQLMLGTYDKSMGSAKYGASPMCSKLADMDLVRTISPFNHAYSDTGLFGLNFVSDGGKDTDTVMLEVVRQISRFCYKVSEEELKRTKNIFKNQVLNNYEGGLNRVMEEIGRQTLFYGRRPNAAEMIARIDAITVEDVKRVAYKYVFDRDPVVAAIGLTDEVVDYSWLKLHTYNWRK